MSACVSFEATYSGCNLLGIATTTTASSFTSTSSSTETPMCTRAPLDLDNDEGDNEQPQKTSGNLSCRNSPLSLDEDEGDNVQPLHQEVHACSRAPLSLDDDEGNNEMPAEVSSGVSMFFTPTQVAGSPSISSLISVSTAFLSVDPSIKTSSMSISSFSLPPIVSSSTYSALSSTYRWGTGSSTGTPTTGNCASCKSYFDDCAKMKCQPDGSDAESCAKWCLTALCQASDSIDYCKVGSCKHSACPMDKVSEMSKGVPAALFTTVLSLSSTQITITATPTSSTAITLSASATPTCSTGGNISPDGRWTAYLEHQIRGHDSSFTWTLWDQNGCEAGKGSVYNNIVGAELLTDIGAQHRPRELKAEYIVQTNVSDSTISSTSEIQFRISKPPIGCSEVCWVQWKINNSLDSKPWQITDDCAQQCGTQKLNTTNLSCDHGINKFQSNEDGSLKKRGGYCTWSISVESTDDDHPPPLPFTRESTWHLKLRQQMEHERSEIEWGLFDPNMQQASYGWKDTSKGDAVNILIETQDRDSRPQDKMRYKMQLTVSQPRYKDKSRVQIQYVNIGQVPGCKYGTGIGFVPECNPSYVTESDDETEVAYINTCESTYDGFQYICDHPLVTKKVMGCDAIPHAFYPKNAGFERKFTCWWPHDFALKDGSDSTDTINIGSRRASIALGIGDGNNGP